jgi:hypothetical protein
MRCETCHGTGTLTLPRQAGMPFAFLAICPTCRGCGVQRTVATEAVAAWARAPRESARVPGAASRPH